MANDIARLIVSLEAQTAKYMAGMEAADARAKRFQAQQKRTLDAVSTSFQRLASVVSVGLLVRGVDRLIDRMDALQESARAANLGTDAFQAWGLAAQQAGVGTEKFASAMTRANKVIGDAVSGKNSAASKFFYDLGISLTTTSGAIRSNEAIIKDFSDALLSMDSAAKRASASAQFFGREIGAQLVPVLEQGSAGLTSMIAKAKELGVVVSEKSLKAADDFKDSLNALSTVAFARFAEGIAPMLPKLAELALKLADATVAAAKFFSTFPDWVKENRFLKWLTTPPGATGEWGGLGALPDGPMDLTGLTAGPGSDKAPAFDAFEKAKSTVKDLATAQEKAYQDMGTSINANLEEGGYRAVQIWSQVPIQIGEANQKLLDLSEYTFDKMSVFAEQAARNMQDSLANYLFDPFDGGIKGMLTNFIDILRRMAAEMAASSIFDFIGGAATKSAGSGGFLGAIGGFFSKLGKRAAGGPVGAGMPYLVGELGPELFVPNVSGYVQPNGGGGVSMNVSIDARGATNPAQMLVAMKLAKDAAIAQIRDQQKRGRR